MFALPRRVSPYKYCRLSSSAFAFSHPADMWSQEPCVDFELPYRCTCIQLQESDRGRAPREGRRGCYKHPPQAGWVRGHYVQSEEVSGNTESRRRLNQSWLEQVVICGRITCERSFCPLIERRWRVGIRNGYWSTVALSASTPMTRQCNLPWSRKVQRCWWVFRPLYSHLYSLYNFGFVIPHWRLYTFSSFALKKIKTFSEWTKTCENKQQVLFLFYYFYVNILY